MLSNKVHDKVLPRKIRGVQMSVFLSPDGLRKHALLRSASEKLSIGVETSEEVVQELAEHLAYKVFESSLEACEWVYKDRDLLPRGVICWKNEVLERCAIYERVQAVIIEALRQAFFAPEKYTQGSRIVLKEIVPGRILVEKRHILTPFPSFALTTKIAPGSFYGKISWVSFDGSTGFVEHKVRKITRSQELFFEKTKPPCDLVLEDF